MVIAAISPYVRHDTHAQVGGYLKLRLIDSSNAREVSWLRHAHLGVATRAVGRSCVCRLTVGNRKRHFLVSNSPVRGGPSYNSCWLKRRKGRPSVQRGTTPPSIYTRGGVAPRVANV
jgi:hypothetical protein